MLGIIGDIKISLSNMLAKRDAWFSRGAGTNLPANLSRRSVEHLALINIGVTWWSGGGDRAGQVSNNIVIIKGLVTLS